MKVFSIDPNSGEYFEDKSYYADINSLAYQGTYNYTPIYPLYTFTTNSRYNYFNPESIIEFYTMLPIKKLFQNYLVEVRYRAIISPVVKDSLDIIIIKFKEFCEMNKIKLNIKNLNTIKINPENKETLISNEPCSNCRETTKQCACMRNKCVKCGKPVGNITFTICDECWDIEHSNK